MGKSVIVTGGGSGIGRAIALRFAKEGCDVALVGRRAEALQETADMSNGKCTAFPCDIADMNAVSTMVSRVKESFSGLDVLVNCAAINIPDRSWSVISSEDFQHVISINLIGTFNCIKACLDDLKQRHGTIININSEAGRRATVRAGCAYVASKFALAGLTESLNAEERLNGLRCVSLYPGEANTALLDKRPDPPPTEARKDMVQPDDVAECAWMAANLPPNALVEELVIRPTRTHYQ